MKTLLESMPGAAEWGKQEELYEGVLSMLPHELAMQAVFRLCRTLWRPSPQEILDAVVEDAYPAPAPADVYSEIIHKAQVIGLNGRRDPNCANGWLPGTPLMSCPIVVDVIDGLGGWRYICSGEANMAGGLRKAVDSAYAPILARWRKEVVRVLTTPAVNRREADVKKYLRKYPIWTTPTGYKAGIMRDEVAAPRIAREDLNVSSFPKDVRDKLYALGLGSIGRQIKAEEDAEKEKVKV